MHSGFVRETRKLKETLVNVSISILVREIKSLNQNKESTPQLTMKIWNFCDGACVTLKYCTKFIAFNKLIASQEVKNFASIGRS